MTVQHDTLVTVALVLVIAVCVVWLILTLAGRR